MAALELALHEVVEHAEVDVAEQLRREVANRQTASGLRVEERLLLRQQLPFVPVADDATVRHWIEHADGFEKVVHQRPIHQRDFIVHKSQLFTIATNAINANAAGLPRVAAICHL